MTFVLGPPETVMSSVDPRPTTLVGIKRLTKALKRRSGSSHSEGLNEAARLAGFQNFEHARRALSDRAASPVPSHPLYLTAYWRSRDGTMGRETLLIRTHTLFLASLKYSELKGCRGLQRFRIDAPDHLETVDDILEQRKAREVVCEAVRTIQFMEATSLRPGGGMGAFGRLVRDLPRRDHATSWIHGRTAERVLLDEPYNGGPEFISERTDWTKRHGLTLSAPAWPGLYVPGSSSAFLIAEANSSELLAILTRRLEALSDCTIADEWSGTSSPYAPVFVSPGRQASGRQKPPRPRPVRAGERRGHAIAYSGLLTGQAWRPDGKMSLAKHREVGRMLKSLLESARMTSVGWRHVNHLRSELDEWVQREHRFEALPHVEFNQLYYGPPDHLSVAPRVLLDRIEARLLKSYPDCVPLRSLGRSVAMARKGLKD